MHANLIPVEWPRVAVLPIQLQSGMFKTGASQSYFIILIALAVAICLVLYIWTNKEKEKVNSLINMKNRNLHAIS